jgi:uncharacterized protein (TIGR02265 family)
VTKLVFAHTVEGLFKRVLGPKATPQLKAELAALGLTGPVDVEQERWVSALKVVVRHLYPGVPPDEAYFRLGRELIAGYEETLLGRAAMGMMRLLGPQRTVRRVMVNLRSANNYAEATSKELSANRYEVWVNECNGNPNYLRGVLFEALARSGAKNLKMDTTAFDGHAATFAVSWD